MLLGKLMPVYKKDKTKPIVAVYFTQINVSWWWRYFTFFCFSFLIFVWLQYMVCRILVPWLGIEPRPLTVKAQSLNHWTTKEFPSFAFPWILKERNSDDRIMCVFYFQFFWNIFLKYFKCQQWNIFLKCVCFFYNQEKKLSWKTQGGKRI